MADEYLEMLLFQEAKNKKWSQAQSLLEEGVDPNVADENGVKLIELAMAQGNLDAIDLSLSYGAFTENTTGISHPKKNWLQIAFMRKGEDARGGFYFRSAQCTFDHYEMPIRNRNKTKSLSRAIKNGDIDAVDYAIDHGANKNIPGIVSYESNWLRIWLTRGDGFVVYWRRLVQLSVGYVQPAKNGTKPRTIEDIIAEAYPSIIEKLFPSIDSTAVLEAAVLDVSNAEIGNNQIVDGKAQSSAEQTSPELLMTPAPSEDDALVLTQESLEEVQAKAEAKAKKAVKRRKAHRREWKPQEGDTEQLNFDFLKDL